MKVYVILAPSHSGYGWEEKIHGYTPNGRLLLFFSPLTMFAAALPESTLLCAKWAKIWDVHSWSAALCALSRRLSQSDVSSSEQRILGQNTGRKTNQETPLGEDTAMFGTVSEDVAYLMSLFFIVLGLLGFFFTFFQLFQHHRQLSCLPEVRRRDNKKW